MIGMKMSIVNGDLDDDDGNDKDNDDADVNDYDNNSDSYC